MIYRNFIPCWPWSREYGNTAAKKCIFYNFRRSVLPVNNSVAYMCLIWFRVVIRIIRVLSTPRPSARSYKFIVSASTYLHLIQSVFFFCYSFLFEKKRSDADIAVRSLNRLFPVRLLNEVTIRHWNFNMFCIELYSPVICTHVQTLKFSSVSTIRLSGRVRSTRIRPANGYARYPVNVTCAYARTVRPTVCADASVALSSADRTSAVEHGDRSI